MVPYVATLILFVGIDLVWLAVVARTFYRDQLGGLMAAKLNYPAALAFYLIYAAGLVFFAVRPALAAGSWAEAAKLGAAFGFVAYATYDLTNLATIRNWPLALTFVDLVWGTVLSATVAAGAVLIARGL
jgi:uncharacterized membrane protein